MSRKAAVESFQMKITRNDRFAQMSHQEKIIEQKKKEIQAKMEQKQKSMSAAAATETNKSNTTTTATTTANKQEKPGSVDAKKSATFNMFSNDGSFLDQFRQMKEKKLDQKLKSFKRDNQEKHNSEERNNTKNSRWSQRRRSSSPNKERPKIRMSRFSEKLPTYDHKININTSYSNIISQQQQQQQTTTISVNTQNVTGQPLMKNMIPPPGVAYPTPTSAPVIIAPPVLLNVPPPTNILTAPAEPVPPPCLPPTVELASIPPPNPIQVHNIPQPEPLNTLTIPPPAPIQVQNIPPPSPIQLNEIPNPKPLDILSIPTPNENLCAAEKAISDPDFIKNIPPPNKSVPPPNITDPTTVCVSLPPPPTVVNVPPPNVLPPPPPPPLPPLQNVLVHTVPPPPQPLQVAANTIQPLMAHPVLPPPGMGFNMNCPPPLMTAGAPPVFVAPPMNVPPPTTTGSTIVNVDGMFKDLNAGSDDYEAMASLGRMVAQCGPGIEDIVRQRKPQDPSLWFLFYKDSAPYKQYEALIEQFKKEMGKSAEIEDNLGEKYEPEMALEDDCDGGNRGLRQKDNGESEECGENSAATERKRKRKSRWGGQDTSVPPPVVLGAPPLQTQTLPVMLTKITRNDPALLQYALTTFGSTNLSEDDWKKAEDHYKINLLYQDMLRKRQEVEKLQMSGKNKYDYDSDEEIDGGTWEHKLREKEMMATQLWATELTKQAEGKHHIGDFLPPEELKRFLEKSTAVKEGRQPNISDYKEFKLKEDNIGFKMLQKLGWSEGQGLGTNGAGIVEPVNKAAVRDHNQGLGLDQPDSLDNADDEYDAYRKRMMLAYRFRPNPLNNPRRPYY